MSGVDGDPRYKPPGVDTPGKRPVEIPSLGVEASILRLPVASEAILIGSGVIEVAFGRNVHARHDTDLVLSGRAFRYLREQPGWVESRLPDGNPRLTNGEYDVGTEAGEGFSFDDLRERGWRTPEGITVASLSDVCAMKQRRSPEGGTAEADKDQGDLALIRSRLLERPLPERVIAHEVAFAKSCLPEHLRDDPDAQPYIQLAANGLHIVRVLYGDDRTGRAKLFSGEFEPGSDRERAYYHQGQHTSRGMRRIQIHMSNINAIDRAAGRTLRFNDRLRLKGLASYGYHDGIYGNGRESDNPERFDEIESARLAAKHEAILGINDDSNEVHDAIEDTGFSQQTGTQKGGGEGRSDLGRSTAGVDLQGISEPSAITDAENLILEDMQAKRQETAYNQILTKVAREQGIVLGENPMDALVFIDAHSNARPSDDLSGPTLIEAYAVGVGRNTGFFIDQRTGYQYPQGWTGENRTMRMDHAVKARELGVRLKNGEITAVDSYREALSHAEEMREKYPHSFDSSRI